MAAYLIADLYVPEPDFAEIMLAEMLDLGFDSFEETTDGLLAYIPTELYDAAALQQLLTQYSPQTSLELRSVEPMPDKNWNAEWESNFQPIVVANRLLVKAPFHHLSTHYPHTIVVEPKMAFGTGHHETTYLMLEALLDLPLAGRSVLDFGCGTGILAIFAKMRYSGYTLAIDYDPLSTQNTLENMHVNHISDIAVVRGDAADIPNTPTFEVVLANITRPVIIESFAALYNCLVVGGVVLFSGILKIDIDMILQTAQHYPLQLVAQQLRGNWAMLQFVKNEAH